MLAALRRTSWTLPAMQRFAAHLRVELQAGLQLPSFSISTDAARRTNCASSEQALRPAVVTARSAEEGNPLVGEAPD